jgi:hypothetical protein
LRDKAKSLAANHRELSRRGPPYNPGKGIAIADTKSRIIVAAEAFGSGNENETFPEMMEKPAETMGTLSGKEKPLKGSIVERGHEIF